MDRALSSTDEVERSKPTWWSRSFLACRAGKMPESLRWALFLGWILLAAAIVLGISLAHGESPAHRARVKDVATIEGIRDNQLVGYGLVVGLHGTGDSSQTVFPAQTLISALERMGVTVPQTGSNSASNMQVKTWRRCSL